MRFLINPQEAEAMAKAKRDPRTGRFLKNPGRTTTKARKRNPARRRKAAPAARKARRVYRRNPSRPDLLGMFTQGTMTALQVLIGKAAARTVPDLAGLPKQGNAGLAIQAAVAVALGYVADMFLSRDTAAAFLAGGLTAPLETFLVAQDVPWIGPALSPTTQAAGVAALTGVGRYPKGFGRYPAPALLAGVGRYPDTMDPASADLAAGYY